MVERKFMNFIDYELQLLIIKNNKANHLIYMFTFGKIKTYIDALLST